MKLSSSSLVKRSRQIALSALLFVTLWTSLAHAQIQQAWTARYNNGFHGGTNQAVKMALDSAGNIYVTGVSENTDTNLGYVLVKYATNGNPLWVQRYDSTNYPNASPASMAVDSSNDVVVTGNAATLEYASNGNLLWSVSNNAAAVAVDPSNNVYMTGVFSNFETMKFSPLGSNEWLRIQQGAASGPQNQAMGIVVDSAGNSFVAGDLNAGSGPGDSSPNGYFSAANYDTHGSLRWETNLLIAYSYDGSTFIGVGGMALDSQTNLFLAVGQGYPNFQFITFKLNGGSGNALWEAFPDGGNIYNRIYGLAATSTGNVFLGGQVFHMGFSAFGIVNLNTNGSTGWLNLYPPAFTNYGGGFAMALDAANNVYVTGYSPGANGASNIVTIKYSSSGTQLWLQRYVAPGGGNAVGNNIAVDAGGNVYVAGYETTPQGGTEMVLIKYAPVTVQRRADGTVLLQAQGAPGETFDVEASADLQSWQDLGQFPADTNGLFQFDDTNAPLYPARFYTTIPQ